MATKQTKAISEDLFINPVFNIKEGDEGLTTIVNLSKSDLIGRWNTQKGKSILSTWRANKFDRGFLDNLVGKYYDHTDIRGITLTGEDLRKVDLSSVDLYGANLENATFGGTDLTNSWLSETNIKGARFDWAKMDGVLLDNVEFDSKTSFVGVNLNAVNFALAALLQDLAIGQQRIAHLEKKHPIFAAFLRYTCDYGRSFRRFIAWCVFIILIFGILFYYIPGSITKMSFWDSLYFSALTFMTLAFGDIQPMSLSGRIVVILEGAIGYIMTGLLIAILARRVIGN